MNQPEPFLWRSARWLTLASALTILVSIAAYETLLALAVVALLLSGQKMRFPPVKLPLTLFMIGTVLSLVFSGEAAAGIPGVRKFYLFLMLLLVYSTLRELKWTRTVVLGWALVAGIGAILGVVQFAGKVREAHAAGRGFYDYYVPGERITGFMGHWMTFSGLQMFALVMLVAFLFYAPDGPRRGWLWFVCAALMTVSLVLAMTRSSWLGSAVGILYLVWFWRRWLVAVIPVAAVIAVVLAPHDIRERVESATRPKQGVDSNQFRFVAWTTGLRIIRAHPLLGLGPEGVKLHFMEYVAPDVPRPLPDGFYGHLHNIYLQFAAERGIPTLLALLWLLGRILRDFWLGLRRLPPGRGDPRFLLQGGIAVVLATMTAGLFEHNLGDSEVLTMFLVVVACGYLALESRTVAESGVAKEKAAVG